jgi:hypothetical protein
MPINDLHLLWDDREPAPGAGPTERCGTKVLDTVLFKESKPSRWLFTNKHSRVAKKKPQNLKLDRIKDRFLRLANVSDKSTGSDFVPVALVYTSDGASTSLTKRAFEELLSSSHDGKSLPGVVALQAVVQVGKSSGCEPMDAPVYRATFNREKTNVKTKRLTNGRSFSDIVQLPGTGRAERAVQKDVRSIVSFVEESGNMSIRELQADFIMDDKHYMWLSRIYRLDATKNDKENSINETHLKQSNTTTKKKIKTTTKNDGGGSSPSTGLPQVRGAYDRPASEQSQRSNGSRSARGGDREERDAHSANTKFRKGKKKQNFMEQNPAGTSRLSSTVTAMPSVGPRPTLETVLDGKKKTNKISKSASAMELGGGGGKTDFPSVQKLGNNNNGSKNMSSSSMEEDGEKVDILKAKVNSLDETISKLQARLTAEATVNARLTERLRTLRENMTKTKDDGQKENNEQLMSMKQAIRDARAEVQESRERESSLTKQVTTLEQQATTLKSRLSAESDIAQRELKKSRQLEKKLADQQRQWTKALREKDELMRREILATEERLHRTLVSEQKDGGKSSESATASKLSPSANALVRTVEELNRKFAAASLDWQDKVAEEQTKHRLAMLEQEEQMSRALAEPRERVRELEDQVQTLQSEMCVMVKDVSIAKKREQELQRRINQATGEKQKMEEELNVLKQSVKAMSSMNSDGSSANDADAKAADVMKATAESKIRQLNNEVDFLRAQLTSESTCRSDLETSLREITVRFQDAKEKWTKTIRELEESKRKEARDMEERFRQEMIAPREQIRRLEDKLQTTQRQLTDMMKDLQLTQDKVDSTESAKRTLETELRATRETMDQRTQELAEARHQVKQLSQTTSGDQAYRATTDAQMRKLQNEIRYLQSQLTSESQCKEDLEHAIKNLRNEIALQEEQHKQDMKDATREAREQADATLERESHLRDHKISLEGEVMNLSKQLTDLKKSYAKIRDQQKIDVQQLDATKKSAARLEVALQSARSELKRERQSNEAQQLRHERAMAAVHQTVQDLTASKKAALASMESQVKAHMEKVSLTQREMLALRDQFDVVQRDHQKRLGAERIATCLCVWQKTRLNTAFGVMKSFLTLDRHAKLMEAKHEMDLKDQEALHLEDKENTCKLLLDEYRKNKDEAMAEFAKHHSAQLYEKATMAEEDLLSHLVRADDQMEDALAEADQEKREALRERDTEHEENVIKLTNAHTERMANELNRAEQEHAQTILSVREDAARTQEAALEHAANAADQARRQRDKEAAEQLSQAVTATESAMRALHEKEVERINEKFKMDMEARLGPLMLAREEMLKLHQKNMEELKETMELNKQTALEKAAKEAKQRQDLAIARQIASSQERINSIREEENKKREETLREAARRLDEGLAAARARAREKREAALAKSAAAHAAEMEKQRKQAEDIKVAALQYQTTKWQQTLKECMVEAKRDKESMRRNMETDKQNALKVAEENTILRLAENKKKIIADCKKREDEALAAADRIHQKALKDLNARKQAALELALERARENGLNQLKQQSMDHEEVLRQRNAAFEEAMRGEQELAQTKLKAALESTEAKAAAERDAALRRAVAESKRRADTIRSECMKEKAEELAQMQNEHNQVIAEITEAARIDRKNALDELSNRARRELDHAVEQVKIISFLFVIFFVLIGIYILKFNVLFLPPFLPTAGSTAYETSKANNKCTTS